LHHIHLSSIYLHTPTTTAIYTLSLHDALPISSSIKIAILLELYRQDQEPRAGAKGKARLDDIYTFDPKDLVEDSRIMAGLTPGRSEEHTSELQSLRHLVCRLLLEKKKKIG